MEDFPGCTNSQVAKTFRMSRAAVAGIVNELLAGGLLVRLDGGLYLGEEGMKTVAHRDRVSPERVEKRFGVYLKPDGKYRKLQAKHDRAVAEVAAAFRLAGIPVAAGWRWEMDLGGRQIRPDIWVLIEIGSGAAMWHAVEAEFSAKAASSVSLKLRPYWAAKEAGHTIPVLVVAGTKEGEKNFELIGDDLPLMVTTFAKFKKGNLANPELPGFFGPGSVWSCKGKQADLNALGGEIRDSGLLQVTGGNIVVSREPEEERDFMSREFIWDGVGYFLGRSEVNPPGTLF